MKKRKKKRKKKENVDNLVSLPLPHHRCRPYPGRPLLLSGARSGATDIYSGRYLGRLLCWLLVPVVEIIHNQDY